MAGAAVDFGEGEVLEEGRPFLPVKKSGQSTYHRVGFEPAGEPGWLVFNEVPDGWTWLGAAVILAGALVITVAEARRR